MGYTTNEDDKRRCKVCGTPDALRYVYIRSVYYSYSVPFDHIQPVQICLSCTRRHPSTIHTEFPYSSVSRVRADIASNADQEEC
jgi:hypothetical protein